MNMNDYYYILATRNDGHQSHDFLYDIGHYAFENYVECDNYEIKSRQEAEEIFNNVSENDFKDWFRGMYEITLKIFDADVGYSSIVKEKVVDTIKLDVNVDEILHGRNGWKVKK